MKTHHSLSHTKWDCKYHLGSTGPGSAETHEKKRGLKGCFWQFCKPPSCFCVRRELSVTVQTHHFARPPERLPPGYRCCLWRLRCCGSV